MQDCNPCREFHSTLRFGVTIAFNEHRSQSPEVDWQRACYSRVDLLVAIEHDNHELNEHVVEVGDDF